MKKEMKELTLSEMNDINGGSTLTKALSWFFGEMFICPAVLDKNDMNLVNMYN